MVGEVDFEIIVYFMAYGKHEISCESMKLENRDPCMIMFDNHVLVTVPASTNILNEDNDIVVTQLKMVGN